MNPFKKSPAGPRMGVPLGGIGAGTIGRGWFFSFLFFSLLPKMFTQKQFKFSLLLLFQERRFRKMVHSSWFSQLQNSRCQQFLSQNPAKKQALSRSDCFATNKTSLKKVRGWKMKEGVGEKKKKNCWAIVLM